MKSFLFYFTMLALCLSAFIGCKDDNTEEPQPPVNPPTLGDIVAKYTSMTLNATVNGVAVSGNAAVAVVKEQDNTMTLQLINIVPSAPVFNIPNSTFEVVTRSGYAGNVDGAKVDSLAGYDVKFTGSVTDSVMTAAITLKEMSGVLTNVKAFYNKTYRGDMKISVANMEAPVVSLQRVYTSKAAGTDTSSIKLQINNFSFSGMALGNISLDTIKVLKRGRIYGFKAEGRKLTLATGEVSLNVYGTIVGNDMNLSLAITAGSLLVDAAFAGGQVTESKDVKIKITLPGNMILQQPVASGNNHTFKAWASVSAGDLKLIPKVTLPQGAVLDSVILYNDKDGSLLKIDTLTPIDFSTLSEGSCVRYHVTPEDVRYPGKSSLFVKRLGTSLYTFENWIADEIKLTPEGLTSNNSLNTFLSLFDINLKEHFLLEKGADNAAVLCTFRTISPLQPQTLIPGITAGTLLNGRYAMDASSVGSVLGRSTFPGELYKHEPEKFKFTYKYTPGEQFFRTIQLDSIAEGEKVDYATVEPVPDEKDECSFNAYLYEVANMDETLNAEEIKVSSKVILKAEFSDGTESANYVEKEVPFVSTGNGTYDAAKLYKLAIICSSSKKWNMMMGAPGSLLMVKRLEVTNLKP